MGRPFSVSSARDYYYHWKVPVKASLREPPSARPFSASIAGIPRTKCGRTKKTRPNVFTVNNGAARTRNGKTARHCPPLTYNGCNCSAMFLLLREPSLEEELQQAQSGKDSFAARISQKMSVEVGCLPLSERLPLDLLLTARCQTSLTDPYHHRPLQLHRATAQNKLTAE
ncbi:hypothetical protein RRG08_024875 [Elysia crispata]|uniref:Uncharacterized protein n=1 Tax=Elysia crispata TaxID=231223 RepID=A0AAE0YJM6_9GAST|nr:hypothetical protein RRG08_024875 [Elysia crispata]